VVFVNVKLHLNEIDAVDDIFRRWSWMYVREEEDVMKEEINK
jgi:hypothetical protein